MLLQKLKVFSDFMMKKKAVWFAAFYFGKTNFLAPNFVSDKIPDQSTLSLICWILKASAEVEFRARAGYCETGLSRDKVFGCRVFCYAETWNAVRDRF